jgi:dTMP kinase
VKRQERGILVAFEGIDGCGKTTQVALLAAALRDRGFDVVQSREPTNGPHGQALRRSAETGRLEAAEELRLFLADRADHARTLIRPALARGAVVILDRYYFSTLAYQGARGLDVAALQRQNEAIAPRPDLVLLIDTPLPVALARLQGRHAAPDRFEEEENLRRVQAVFAAMDDPAIVRLDGTMPIEPLAAAALQAVQRLIPATP